MFPLRVIALEDISAAEYRMMTRLPLAQVSPNPSWYGVDPEDFPPLDE